MVPLRGFPVHPTGEVVGGSGVPEIVEEAQQSVAAGPAKSDEMKLAIASHVFTLQFGGGKKPHIVIQFSHFRDVVGRKLRNRHPECLVLKYLPPVVNVRQVV